MQAKYQIRNRAYRRRMERKRQSDLKKIFLRSTWLCDYSLRFRPTSFVRVPPPKADRVQRTAYLQNPRKAYKTAANRSYRHRYDPVRKGNHYRKYFPLWDELGL